VAPVLVTLPLVLAPFARDLPHYWIAAWMGFPRDGQYAIYWWSSGPTVANPNGYGLALTAIGLTALVVTFAVPRLRDRR
jgi:hypothetical protein